MVFTAYDRLHVLSRALKQKEFDEQVDARKSVHAYMEKVVPDRNILGHQVLSPEGKPTAVVDASGKQISLDETRDLRKLILSLALISGDCWRRCRDRARRDGLYWEPCKISCRSSPSALAMSGGTAFATCVKRGTSRRRSSPPVVYFPLKANQSGKLCKQAFSRTVSVRENLL